MPYVEKQRYNLKSDFYIFFSTVLILDWWWCDIMEYIVLTVSLLPFIGTQKHFVAVFFLDIPSQQYLSVIEQSV